MRALAEVVVALQRLSKALNPTYTYGEFKRASTSSAEPFPKRTRSGAVKAVEVCEPPSVVVMDPRLASRIGAGKWSAP